jgi:putative Mn2+ efflux pump MntP
MEFIISNIFLGIGLAADAFCASLSNGMNEPKMRKTKTLLIGFIFATFQAIMPLIGWFCVRNIVEFLPF